MSIPGTGPGEIIALSILLVGCIFTLRHLTRLRIFLSGFTALFIGGVATVAEAAAAPTIMNIVQHVIGSLVAGTLFFWYAWKNWKAVREADETIGTIGGPG